MPLTFSNYALIDLISLVIGAIGTWVAYKASSGGGGLGAYADAKLIEEVRNKGLLKQRQQKWGLGLLMGSLIIQAIMLFFRQG